MWKPTCACSLVCICFSDMVLDQHEVSGSVGQDARKRIREALLKQHHHQNHKKLANRIPIVRSFADIGKKQSEPHSMDKNGEQTHIYPYTYLTISNTVVFFTPCVILCFYGDRVCCCMLIYTVCFYV